MLLAVLTRIRQVITPVNAITRVNHSRIAVENASTVGLRCNRDWCGFELGLFNVTRVIIRVISPNYQLC
jgi:hypothetical protein